MKTYTYVIYKNLDDHNYSIMSVDVKFTDMVDLITGNVSLASKLFKIM